MNDMNLLRQCNQQINQAGFEVNKKEKKRKEKKRIHSMAQVGCEIYQCVWCVNG
jgi:hypothetical protein